MNRQQRRASRARGITGRGTLADRFAATVAQHRAGAFAEAERGYHAILLLDPNHADSLHNLGLLALQRGDAASAADLIGKAIAINDRVAEYHYNMALAFHALGRMDQVTAQLERTIALRGDHMLALLNLGNVRREQGKPTEALALFERALTINPNLVPARFNLANLQLQQSQPDAAIANLEKILTAEPGHAEANFQLGVAYLAAGRPDLAVQASIRALELKETAQTKILFAQCVKSVQVTAENPRLRALVLRALEEGWARPRELANVCISLVKLDGAVKDCIARVKAARPGCLAASDLFAALATLANDELLIKLLQRDPITDIGFEYVLTSARATLLNSATNDEEHDTQLLEFYAALARQCFINEYAYSLPPHEAEQAHALRQKLAKAIADNATMSPLWVVAAGAYVPLHTVTGAETLLDRPWPEPIAALLVQQVTEPARERQIAAQMPRLTVIDDEISRAVRQQYEENPYPRWTDAEPSARRAVLDERSSEKADVLIAGCGTGLSTIEFARQKPNARVLAIDLSLASLSYARRMAESFGLTNIEFAQADIKEAASIDRQFDFIDASGVLHHMGDPWAGWKALLARLRPDGTMQIGLYSELARRNVVAARALIAARGYMPMPEGIRHCREYIMATDDSLLKSLMSSSDFYTINECRDLLFHAQEHRMTLPQIKSFLAANAARFAGFVPDPAILQRFTARFPEPSAVLDLDCWHSFETEEPNTFVGMYQFWVRKLAA
jgi:tetratricopeptide (TPR) repeat protein/2-polyprenyl-3-methyl-5-hydroxy-6-metoxy-1,4-benzoquinol methylase